MITIDLDPTIFHFGPVMITWYGLAVLVALATGVWLTRRESVRKAIPVDPVADLLLWVVAGGLVGARLLRVLDRWDFYAANPAQILAIQNGGLAILGALLGGALAGGLAAWRSGLPVGRVFDAAAPGLVLGQAIGRLGCLVTGDTLGRPTDGSWGIVYLNPGAMAPQLGVAYQPDFFYELVWDLAIFAVLWALRGKLKADGQLFALYLGLYAAGKFALTFLRTETVWFWGLQEAQVFAVAGLAIALLWWASSSRTARTAGYQG
ncbi:MAG: prolipoprotein diacylglyceryl transferase [Chloroflexi bacterium]|nr:prolipoprotein diacylglyceryl transferase [Chloroflexota bacterium]